MKRKKVILHIGLHKTGSSSIQLGLYENMKPLSELGFLYPVTGTHYYWGHHNLAWEILSHHMHEPEKGSWDALYQEIENSKASKVILSSEAFSMCSLEQIKMLRDRLSGFDVEIVVYLRNQVEWLQSFWCELAKGRQGGVEAPDLDTWALNSLPKSDANRFLPVGKNLGNFLSLIENWEDVFSKSSVRVKSFEESLHDDLFLDFLSDAGVESFEAIALPERVNETVSIKKLNLIRNIRANLRIVGCNESVIEGIKKIIMESSSIGGDTKGIFFKEKTVRKVIDRYKEINRALNEEYFQGKDLLNFDSDGKGYGLIEDYTSDEVSLLISELVTSEYLNRVSFGKQARTEFFHSFFGWTSKVKMFFGKKLR